MNGQRVLLMHLAERTSAKGNPYLAGWLGKARLVGFKAREPDKHGNEVWEIYAQEPEERDQAPRQSPTRDAAGPMPAPPQGWIDDSDAAIRDLVEAAVSREGDR